MPESWRDSLPDNLKNHTSLQDVKDVESLADQFVNAQERLGTSIRIPGPDASDEDKKAFHKKLMDKVPALIPTPNLEDKDQMSALYKVLGRPDEAAGYEYPEGFDATHMGDFATMAHGLGITTGQYKSLLTSLNDFNTKQNDTQNDAFAAAITGLKQEWGIVYEDNLALVNNVMKGTGAPKAMMELAASGKLPAESIKWLHNIGNQLGTEGINFHKDDLSTTRLAPSEAKAQAAELIGNKEGPYWQASDPGHAAAITRYVDLMRAASAGT